MAMPALGFGVSLKEICRARLLRLGLACFFNLRLTVTFFLISLPFFRFFLTLRTYLNRYWSMTALARAAKPEAPPSAQESCIWTLWGPSLLPSRAFFLSRSCAI